MNENEHALPQAGLDSCAQNPEKLCRKSGRERKFLLFTLGFCMLLADTVLWYGPRAGAGLAVAVWYILLFAYAGTEGLKRRENRVLLTVNLLLAATLALTSNWYFRIWNLLALMALVPIHLFAVSGATALPWWRPAMLWERLQLLCSGLICNAGAAFSLTSCKEEKGKSRLAVAAGCLGALALVAVLLPVLASADALFDAATRGLTTFLRQHLSTGLQKAGMGLLLTPFLFGLLHRMGHPQALKKPVQPKTRTTDDMPFVIILTTLDALYLLFLAVQSAGLFGGAEYLAQRGISYADWARSGFFQMVGVTAVNLSVLLASVIFSRRQGKIWPVLRLLAALLTVESGLLLSSAVWRMSLYVSAYGLSFLRVMTYWGMAVMAVLLAAAARKILKPDFSFCRVAFLAAVLGWVIISFVPVDFLVAQNHVNRYLSGETSTVDVEYLAGCLSYDSLSQLERLDGSTLIRTYRGGGSAGETMTLSDLISARREEARRECTHWESWSLSACLAG